MKSLNGSLWAIMTTLAVGCAAAPENLEGVEPAVQSSDALGERFEASDNRYTYDFSRSSLNLLNGSWGLNGSRSAIDRVKLTGSRDSAILTVAAPCSPGLPTPGGNPVNGLVVSAGLVLNCWLSEGVGSANLTLQRTSDREATSYCSPNQFRFRVSGPVRDASGLGTNNKLLGWGCLYAATFPRENRASVMTLSFIDGGGNRQESYYEFTGR
jgi:hypothetical protein